MEDKGIPFYEEMDFFSRVMSFGEKLGRKKIKSEPSSECIRIYELQDELNALLKGTKYVARSEYAEITPAYKELVEFFRVLQNSMMLKSYCAQNGITEGEVLKVIDLYDHLGEKVDAANDEYIKNQMISEKDYFDNILKEVDPVIVLDEDQRRVILTDEDYCLVIAGAGAGKTTTVAAKVKYLVEKKGIDPKQILVVSFTNKAVQELRDFLENGNIKNSVNYPSCDMGVKDKTRITIMHRNIPNMIGQFTALLAKDNVNIDDMTNKNSGAYAYTMMDVDSEVGAEVVDGLEAIEGVLRVRVIE